MVEIADIFRLHGREYLSKHGDKVLPSHRKAVMDIIQCRTHVMGGVVYYCRKCNEYDYSYHSCGNRNCPKCQNDKAEEWLEKNNKLLLPVNYFMITFTLPDTLRKAARSNQKLFYKLLFKCSSKSIEQLSADTKYIGGKPGMIGLLHTWSRDISYHPHVHYIITGGGLSQDMWLASKNNFILSVKALSKIFKAKFRDELKRTVPALFNSIPSKVWKDNLVVNSIPVGNGSHAMKYLAQYIFRVAISNNKILAYENDMVTFKYKDSRTKTWKTKTLKSEEFIRRFLQHVLPGGFVKIRYYGLFANKNRELLETAMNLISLEQAIVKEKPIRQSPEKKKKCFICKSCKEVMTIISRIPRGWSRCSNNKAPPQILFVTP
jgi:hypothetical protein